MVPPRENDSADELPHGVDTDALLASAPFGLLVIDSNSTIRYVNQRIERILGYSADELVGESLAKLIPERLEQAHFESFERYQETGERHLDWDHIELPGLHADGTEVPLAISFQEYHPEEADLFVGIIREISDRKEREAQLERQNEEMEFFNSLLRHDILNGITVIRTRGSLLAEELDGTQQEHAEVIVEWADNVTSLVQRVRNVLNTLTGEDAELERANLSEILRQQVDSVSKTYPEVVFETGIPPRVFVQAGGLLSDVFKNLLTNAIEHNEPEGLRVKATAEKGAKTVTVRIADNGRGIPDDLKEELFQRGATGHVKKAGSGFGLFFVNAMVTAYGGNVKIEDNEMGGATFVIELSAGAD